MYLSECNARKKVLTQLSTLDKSLKEKINSILTPSLMSSDESAWESELENDENDPDIHVPKKNIS